jgi:hypothetical protein
MRPGLRALALFLASALPACGKPAPSTCPLPASGGDGGAATPDASADAGGAADGGLDAGREDGGVDFCAACGVPGSCGRVSRAEVTAASGIAASIRSPGAYYLHSGALDAPRFFAVSAAGADLGAYSLGGARNIDWEDVAVGPCPGGTCVYLADIGDKDGGRMDYVVYRVAEPFLLSAGEHAVPFEALHFAYPDGKSHDAATLLIHPVTGLLTVVTREPSGSDLALLYDFPSSQPSPAAPSTLIRRGQLSLPAPDESKVIDGGSIVRKDVDNRITGGDVHPKGLGVILRTRTDLFRYGMKPEQTVADALGGTPCSFPVAQEAEGGAVAWLPSGGGLVTVGEGAAPDLYFSVCGAN